MIESNLNDETQSSSLKPIIKIFTFSITIFITIIVLYAIKSGIFQDKNLFIDYIKNYGAFAPMCFIILQIIQVIFPIIPGAFSCLAGVLAFGPIPGFIYNYIGLLIGSCIAYFLSKKYGLNLIKKIFKKETIDKYLKYIEGNYSFKIFLIAIILPGFPDDLLCYIAGISSIKFKQFLLIILVGKPLSLLTYSLFMKLL